jgi:uncharacterized protein
VKITTVLIVGVLLAAWPARGQLSPSGTPQKPASPAQPGPSRAKADSGQSPAEIENAAAEKVDPAKEAAIRRLLDVTDTSKIGDHLSGAISMQVRSAMSRTLEDARLQKFMVDFDQKFHARLPSGQVTDRLVPIYAQHFSKEDIQGLVQFYESPLGQRVVKTLPEVVQESQNAGMKLEQEAAMAILQEMANDYPELKSMLGDQPHPAPAQAPKPTSPQPQN